MKIEPILETIGLNKKEARVYFTGLKLGQETAFRLAQKSGLKRSTVYFVLEKLKNEGLTSVKQTRKATFYSMLSPQRLLRRLERKKEKLREILPELEKFYRQQPHKPHVQIFEGRAGVESVYFETEEYLKKYKEVLYYGSTRHFLTKYRPLLDLWIKSLKNKRYRAREILVREEIKKSDYLAKIKHNRNPHHQIRFFPADIKFVENDNLIYGNKIAIFSVRKEVFVISIDSENIAESYRQYFEFAWQNAGK